MPISSLKYLARKEILDVLNVSSHKHNEKLKKKIQNTSLPVEVQNYIVHGIINRKAKEKDLVNCISLFDNITIDTLDKTIFCYQKANRVLEVVLKHFPHLKKLSMATECALRLEKIVSSMEKTSIPPLTHLELSLLCVKKLDVLEYFGDSLDELTLTNCFSIPQSELLKIKAYIPKLKKLVVIKSDVFSLNFIPESVEDLSLQECKELIGQEFKHLKKITPQLKKLSIKEISIKNFEGIPSTVTELRVHACQNISNNEYASLKQIAPHLKILELSQVNFSNPDDLVLQMLQSLKISGCKVPKEKEKECKKVYPFAQIK